MSDQNERDLLVALEKVRGKPPSRALPKLNVCGDIGLKIARDGTWSYQGSPIGRKPLVKLFASVLRKEEDGYLPRDSRRESADRGRGHAVRRRRDVGQRAAARTRRLSFRTNIDEVVTVDGREHRLGFDKGATGGFVPFIVVRDGLAARLTRPVYYELAALAMKDGGTKNPGVWSGGAFFPFPAGEAVD